MIQQIQNHSYKYFVHRKTKLILLQLIYLIVISKFQIYFLRLYLSIEFFINEKLFLSLMQSFLKILLIALQIHIFYIIYIYIKNDIFLYIIFFYINFICIILNVINKFNFISNETLITTY